MGGMRGEGVASVAQGQAWGLWAWDEGSVFFLSLPPESTLDA